MRWLNRLAIRWHRTINFEYWPSWLFYLPMLPYATWLILKARSLTLFTAVNPSINNSGVLESSKYDALKLIPQQWLPTTLLVKLGTPLNDAVAMVSGSGITYPFIAKPDIGERGKGVEKINSDSELATYLMEAQMDTILQAYIDFPVELGVFYYRYPDEANGIVNSVVIKDFLTVIGDGKSTLAELMNQHIRAQKRMDYLLQKFDGQLDNVLPTGEKLLLEPIGNHSRGTTFLNGNHLLNNQLNQVFDTICKDIPGFYYGRLDIRVPSVEDLYAGKHIKVMELNGVSSEPGHIYDPQYSLIKAYRDLHEHAQILYRIGTTNHKNGVPYKSWAAFRADWKQHNERNA